jgi:hypothetical protein
LPEALGPITPSAAGFQREIDVVHDQFLRAGRRHAQCLDGQDVRRGRQLESRRGRRHRSQELAQPPPALPRRHKALPIGDGEIDRRQGAPRQNRARDDDARGRFLPDDQQRADTEHGRLQRHAQHAPRRAQSARDVVHALLLRAMLASEIEPTLAQRFGHAHCRKHVGVAPAVLRETGARFDRPARQKFGRERQGYQNDRPGQDGDADERVKGKADREVEGNPWQVEQRGRTKARQKGTDRIEVADRLQTVASRPRPQRQPHDEVVDATAQPIVELIADPQQQPAARDLERGLKAEQDGGQDRQADQGGHAAARQDAVVNLQHI